MKTLRNIALLLAVLMCSVAAMAQNQVRWRTTVKMTDATHGVLTVKALVNDGFHLYGTDVPKGGPVATTLNFDASTGIKFTGAFKPSVAPVKKKDAMFDMTLTYWNAPGVTFTRTFKLTGKKEDAVIKGSVKYMACDDKNCTPPKTENITLKIK